MIERTRGLAGGLLLGLSGLLSCYGTDRYIVDTSELSEADLVAMLVLDGHGDVVSATPLMETGESEWVSFGENDVTGEVVVAGYQRETLEGIVETSMRADAVVRLAGPDERLLPRPDLLRSASLESGPVLPLSPRDEGVWLTSPAVTPCSTDSCGRIPFVGAEFFELPDDAGNAESAVRIDARTVELCTLSGRIFRFGDSGVVETAPLPGMDVCHHGVARSDGAVVYLQGMTGIYVRSATGAATLIGQTQNPMRKLAVDARDTIYAVSREGAALERFNGDAFEVVFEIPEAIHRGSDIARLGDSIGAVFQALNLAVFVDEAGNMRTVDVEWPEAIGWVEGVGVLISTAPPLERPQLYLEEDGQLIPIDEAAGFETGLPAAGIWDLGLEGYLVGGRDGLLGYNIPGQSGCYIERFLTTNVEALVRIEQGVFVAMGPDPVGRGVVALLELDDSSSRLRWCVRRDL